jgi:sugar O-acyltransferase (sialic acid O-acetyltransferase NeuD family)
MGKKLLIIGASGHGKVLADIAINMKKWSDIAFIDDNKSTNISKGLKVLGTTDDILDYIDTHEIIVGIGNNEIRGKLQKKLESLGATIPTLIHPKSIIGESVRIDSGTVVMAGAVINCCSKIGKGCIINTSATVDHDNKIEDFVHISPGANLAGTVRVGKGSWLGIGSVISNNVSITNDCIIGAGSVVINDISEVGTYIGVPVRRK